MAKYKGKDLSLLIDSEEVNLEGISVVLQSEDADTDSVTFAELADGTPQQWFFLITAVSDYGAGSLWDKFWQQAGNEIPYSFKPYGNMVASASQPHFTGVVLVPKKPPIGGTAGTTFTFEQRLDCTAAPTLDDGES